MGHWIGSPPPLQAAASVSSAFRSSLRKLIALAYGLPLYGSTTVADLTCYLADAMIWALRYAAAGAVIGWWLGRGK